MNIYFISTSGPNRVLNSYLVFGRIVAVGSNINTGHVTSVSTFGPHGMNLFTELELLLTFVRNSY